MPGFGEDRRRAPRRYAVGARPGHELVSLACLELDVEMACVPKSLGAAKSALSLDAIVDAAVPLAPGDVACAGDAVSVLELEAIGGDGDGRRTIGEALAMYVAPGAERMQLQGHRSRRPDDAMDDGHGGAPVVHGKLPFDHHVADGPPPAGQALIELEALEVGMAFGVDRPRRPFMSGQGDPAVADDHDR